MNVRYGYSQFHAVIGPTAKRNWFEYVYEVKESCRFGSYESQAEKGILREEYDAEVKNEGGQRYYFISDAALSAFLLRFG